MTAAPRLFACMLTGLLLLGGCRTPSEAPGTPASSMVQDPAERDAVLTTLRGIKQEAFQQAFVHLSGYHYTRYTRATQGDAATPRAARTEATVRVEGSSEQRTMTTLQADTTGSFDVGALGAFVMDDPAESAFASLPQYVFDDPPYLASRNRDAFLYRFLPDTTFWGAATQVISVQARPGEGDNQAIRHTRLYIDRASQELIAVYVERAENTLFFDEESRFYLRLRPSPAGEWLPFNARFSTRLHLPLRAPKQFHTVSTYYHYEPAS